MFNTMSGGLKGRGILGMQAVEVIVRDNLLVQGRTSEIDAESAFLKHTSLIRCLHVEHKFTVTGGVSERHVNFPISPASLASRFYRTCRTGRPVFQVTQLQVSHGGMYLPAKD